MNRHATSVLAAILMAVTAPLPLAAQAGGIFRADNLRHEPYPALRAKPAGAGVSASPDPLVTYRWKDIDADDDLEIYVLKPVAVTASHPAHVRFRGALRSGDITVTGACDLRFDFGQVNAGWLEFECDALTGEVACSISEFNEPAVFNAGSQHPRKTLAPTRYGKTFRLELNRELYEGVRYAWIHVKSVDKSFRIKNVRLVCQTKPVNYEGRFDSNDATLNRIWYTAAYTVRLNLLKDYFGAILMERSDRFSWTGDAHTSQAAALVAFGNYDFIRKNLLHTADQSNGIRSYPLYWVQSLVDYYEYTGDRALLLQLTDNACGKLDDACDHFDDPRRSLAFYGWDERLGAGFEHPDRAESRLALKMLTIQTMERFSRAMAAAGREDLAARYAARAEEKRKAFTADTRWTGQADLFSASDAVNAGAVPAEAVGALWEHVYADRLQRVSYSPFNEYFVLNALARLGRYAEAMNTIDDCWGGQLRYGATTFFEVFRPSWNLCKTAENDAPVNNQCGYTSLTHPWSAGVAKWLTGEVLGVKPETPGFETFTICPHLTSGLTRVEGDVPTPHGKIRFSIDVLEGRSTVSVPAGTLGRLSIPLMGAKEVKVTLDGKPVDAAALTPTHAVLPPLSAGEHVLQLAYSDPVSSPSVEEDLVYAVPASAVSEDGTTQGNWKGVYGSKGYVLFSYDGPGADRIKLPAGCTAITPGKQGAGCWTLSSADPRALVSNRDGEETRSLGTIFTRDPSACYQTMTLDVPYRTEKTYRLTLYFVDWDSTERRSAIELFDLATLRLLSPVHMVRDYSGGRYVTFEVDRPVRVRVCQVRGANAAVCALFLD